MTIITDFEIQNDKDVRYIGAAHGVAGAGYYTVYEFHDWLRSVADDASAATADDFLDISKPTPSNQLFTTIIELLNGFNVDQTASEHLYNGSIVQTNGDEIFDGIQVVANEGCHVEIVQNGAILTNDFWNSTPDGESSEGLNRDVANGISARFMVKVRTGAADIDGRRLICQTREFLQSYSEFKLNGTSRGINVVPLTYTDDINNDTAASTVSGWTDVTNATEGRNPLDIDDDSVDEYFYSEWTRASRTINQFYERMKWLTMRGSGSTIYGLNGELFRGITHQFDYDNEATGPFSEATEITWTEAGVPSKGQLLALLDSGLTGTMWIQLKTGIAPTNNTQIAQTGGKTCDVNGTVTERALSFPFCGVSTGTSIIGAFGFGVIPTDLGINDKVFDLAGVDYSPPNFVTYTVGGLVSTEDYVLVGPHGYRFFYDNEATGPFSVGETLTFTSPAGTAVLADLLDLGLTGEMYIGPMLSGDPPVNNSTIAGATATADVNGAVSNDINLRQLTLNGALTGGAVVSVVVNEAIPTDTPGPNGTIRIKRASGKYTRHPYSAINYGTKTFTITSHDFSGDNAANGAQVFISYIDMLADSLTESFTGVFLATRALFIRARDGGTTPIKTFESTGTLTSAGGSITIVRTSD